MTYKELLEKYKHNQLEEAMKKQIEEDIEKQDAISNYLFEQLNDEDWDDGDELRIQNQRATEHGGEQNKQQQNKQQQNKQQQNKQQQNKEPQSKDESEQFVRIIQKNIRKAFMKFGIVVVGITIIIMGFIQMLLPKVISRCYYNPAKKINAYTNQVSRDLSVYTELVLPDFERDNVAVESQGYGNYDILIYQNYSNTGTFTNVAGKIEKNKMTLYNPNVLKLPSENMFGWYQLDYKTIPSLTEYEKMLRDEKKGEQLAGYVENREESRTYIKEIGDNYPHKYYVTLDRVMSYEEFDKFCEDNKVPANWCAVVTSENCSGTIMGFDRDSKSAKLQGNWNKEQYPELFVWNSEEDRAVIENNIHNQEFMTTHFVSMLTYLKNQKEFSKMMDVDWNTKDVIEYVTQEKLPIQGFVMEVKKEEALQVLDLPEIYGMIGR